MKKKPHHYVNNKEFLDHIMEYKADPENHTSKEFIGKAFLDIARGVSNMYNFQNYTYKDDMISEAVLNCYIYMHNFDPDKSKNPFSYFTQIIYYAFLRYIKKEKKQLYIKYKLIRDSNNLLDFSDVQEGDFTYYSMPTNQFSDDLNRGIDEFIQNYEKGMDTCVKKRANSSRKKTSLELAMEMNVSKETEDVCND